MTSQPIITRRDFLAISAIAGAGAVASKSFTADRASDVSWLDEVQQPPRSLPADAPRLTPLLVDADGKPITQLAQWNKRRANIRKWWLDFLGPFDVPPRPNPELHVIEEDRVEDVLRQRVRYHVEPGLATEAYLLRPAATGKNRPAAAVFHSTVDHSIRQPAGVEGRPEKAFGLTLAKRGFVTFCPRNYLWPTNEKISAGDEAVKFLRRRPRCKGMAKMLYDAQVAVDILIAQPDVDPGRIGSVGHSLGAKEVLYLAALDERVKATVSSEGGVGTKFSNWDAAWYLGPEIKQPAFNHEHHELLALAAPRAFLLIGGDSADGAQSWPFIEAALPVYKLHGGPPRLGLFNHGQGHAVPPDAERRIYEWLETYV